MNNVLRIALLTTLIAHACASKELIAADKRSNNNKSKAVSVQETIKSEEPTLPSIKKSTWSWVAPLGLTYLTTVVIAAITNVMPMSGADVASLLVVTAITINDIAPEFTQAVKDRINNYFVTTKASAEAETTDEQQRSVAQSRTWKTDLQAWISDPAWEATWGFQLNKQTLLDLAKQDKEEALVNHLLKEGPVADDVTTLGQDLIKKNYLNLYGMLVKHGLFETAFGSHKEQKSRGKRAHEAQSDEAWINALKAWTNDKGWSDRWEDINKAALIKEAEKNDKRAVALFLSDVIDEGKTRIIKPGLLSELVRNGHTALVRMLNTNFPELIYGGEAMTKVAPTPEHTEVRHMAPTKKIRLPRSAQPQKRAHDLTREMQDIVEVTVPMAEVETL